MLGATWSLHCLLPLTPLQGEAPCRGDLTLPRSSSNTQRHREKEGCGFSPSGLPEACLPLSLPDQALPPPQVTWKPPTAESRVPGWNHMGVPGLRSEATQHSGGGSETSCSKADREVQEQSCPEWFCLCLPQGEFSPVGLRGFQSWGLGGRRPGSKGPAAVSFPSPVVTLPWVGRGIQT